MRTLWLFRDPQNAINHFQRESKMQQDLPPAPGFHAAVISANAALPSARRLRSRREEKTRVQELGAFRLNRGPCAKNTELQLLLLKPLKVEEDDISIFWKLITGNTPTQSL